MDYKTTIVTDNLAQLLQREAASLANCATFKDDLRSAVDCISDVPEGMELITDLRDLMKSILVMEAESAAHKEAVMGVAQSYVPPQDGGTKWADELAASMQTHMSNNPCDPEGSAEVRRFDQDAGLARAGGNDDDDVICDDGGATCASDKCPLSQKSVFDILDPVVDEKGYIYSMAALVAYMGTRPSTRCPMSGTSHFVSRATVNAERAKRMIKKMRRRAAMNPQPQANRRQQDIVLDAE